MEPEMQPECNENTAVAHTPKSENSVAPGTISTTEGNSETDVTTKTTPLTQKSTISPEAQPQIPAPIESDVSTSTKPPETTQDAPSYAEVAADGTKSEVADNPSSSQSLQQTTESESAGSNLPANTITVEAETDSKEATNQPADPQSKNDASNSKSSFNPSNGAASMDSSSSVREDDFITSPHGKNAIVERSPGGRYVRFMEKLGSGASKEVYRAYDTQEGIEVAWNVVHLAGVPRNERNRIVNEVQLLERLHHHNIISFHGSWVNRAEQQVNFVTEILSSGTLKSFITKVQVIRWKIAKRWAVQILKGLEYLHAQDPPVIHRDLKCENIFINGTSGDLRIGDLGLSTVHRHGKQLSVLGTPEFMAPDLYEETPYDEKVDVYAFGMCMLEIFTKEIPYRECSNPAQIYKKVSRGDPPASLKRIQSRHAREFVELCLGFMDENGKYIRPSATELLAHPFLQKRPNDDDEVEVLPPIQERTIRETASTSSPSTKAAVPKDRVSPTSSSTQPNETIHGASSSSRQMQHSRQNSLNDDGSDKFEEMPDSEVNMRKVKVLVGRGLELKEEDENQARKARETNATDSSVQSAPAELPPQNQNLNLGPPTVPIPPPGELTQPTKHYLVAAAVIENDTNARPYENDILKLVVTLPVEGQTQNVQFDFHLVQDDAIQVAKEMVAELGIPQGAVLEISETISGLARAARVSQDAYLARQKAQQGHHVSNQLPSVTSLPTMGSNSEMSQNMAQQPPQQGQSMVSSTSHHSMPDQQAQHTQHLVPNHQQTSHVSQSMQSKGMHVSEQHVPIAHAQHPQSMQPQGVQGSDQPVTVAHAQHSQPMQQQSVPIANAQHAHSMQAQGVQGQEQSAPMAHTQHAQEQSVPMSHAQHSQSMQAQGMRGPDQSVSMAHTQHPQTMQKQGMQNQEPPVPLAHAQHAPQMSHAHMQSQHVNVQPNDMPNQNSETSSQSFAQQAPSHMNHVNAGQQVENHRNHQVSSAPPADTNASQPNYGQPIPVPSQIGARQTSGISQADTPMQYVQSQQLPISSQPGSQPSGHHAPGNHVMQQHQSGPAVAPQSGIVQAPVSQSSHVPQQGNQIQGYSNGNSSHAQSQPAQQHPQHVPFQQQQPMHQQQQPMHQQQSQSAPQTQQVVSAAGPAGQAEGPGPAISPQVPYPTYDELASMSQMLGSEASLSVPFTQPMNGINSLPAMMERLNASSESDQLDEELAAELRKLDEEFKKTVNRAKKVFDSRMDNMARLQHQREAQHLRTLTEHEKQRAEFEKRLQQEEIEQNKRIVQLQKEWERKREQMRRIQESEMQAQENDVGNDTPISSMPDNHADD